MPKLPEEMKINFNHRVSERHQDMLFVLAAHYKCTRAEVIRKCIEKVYESVVALGE